MEDDIQELRDKLQELQHRKAEVIRRNDGIPPLRTWASKLNSALGSVLVPDADTLRRQIDELEDWLIEYE